ncbi:hypothetical protein ACFVTC_26555 [Streptomyces sp. NPDC057950]|uniref:hypothetical protein n=1 Tax=Streptomyces sp. NPDC057950 TaxID=3346288 RepID=UPI0036EFB282
MIGFRLVVVPAGGAAAGRLPDRLSSDFSLPGQEGSETRAAPARTYGVSADLGCLPVLAVPAGRTTARADVTAVARRLRALGGVQVLDQDSTGDPGFPTEDGHSTFFVFYGP